METEGRRMYDADKKGTSGCSTGDAETVVFFFQEFPLDSGRISGWKKLWRSSRSFCAMRSTAELLTLIWPIITAIRPEDWRKSILE